jgi:type IV secretory pathway TrbD component
MRATPERHPVHKALHLPLTSLEWTGFPIERRMCRVGLVVGLLFYGLTTWLVMGVLAAIAVWGFARWSITRDPHMLALMWQSQKNRRRYDPAKGHPAANDSAVTVLEVR